MKQGTKIAAFLSTLLFCASAFGTDLAILQNGFSIRHDHREVIGFITRLYIGADNISYIDVPTAQIEHFERDLTPVAPPEKKMGETEKKNVAGAPLPILHPLAPVPMTAFTLNQAINSASDHTQINPDLISCVIHAESGFNPHAVSPKGAQGLMQLMPKTAANLGVANAFDPAANVDGGARYLLELLELYKFDLPKALAAYNAGPLRVQQYHGVPPYRETRAYVARIIRDCNNRNAAEQKAALAAKKKAAAQKDSPATQKIAENPHKETSQSSR